MTGPRRGADRDGGQATVELALLLPVVVIGGRIIGTVLNRQDDPNDEVVVTLDAGPPTPLYRRVLLGFRLDPAEAHRLAGALERTEVTMMLKPAFAIRTQIEPDGEPLT